MPIVPSELPAFGDAEDLLDLVCTAGGAFLTDTEKARALRALTVALEALRLRWRAEWVADLLDTEDH